MAWLPSESKYCPKLLRSFGGDQCLVSVSFGLVGLTCLLVFRDFTMGDKRPIWRATVTALRPFCITARCCFERTPLPPIEYTQTNPQAKRARPQKAATQIQNMKVHHFKIRQASQLAS